MTLRRSTAVNFCVALWKKNKFNALCVMRGWEEKSLEAAFKSWERNNNVLETIRKWIPSRRTNQSVSLSVCLSLYPSVCPSISLSTPLIHASTNYFSASVLSERSTFSQLRSNPPGCVAQNQIKSNHIKLNHNVYIIAPSMTLKFGSSQFTFPEMAPKTANSGPRAIFNTQWTIKTWLSFLTIP